MVCVRNICINTLHKRDNDDDYDYDDDDNNNNNNNNIIVPKKGQLNPGLCLSVDFWASSIFSDFE